MQVKLIRNNWLKLDKRNLINNRGMKISALWLAPMAFLYGIATRFRNYLYNIGYSKSFNYEIMVIVVGNLSAGGTGKSPMTEYLIRLLHEKYSLVTLSRGYKRKTKGFLFADQHTMADEIGDEPYQMYLKYNKVARVAVGEERTIAIPNILLEHPETQVVIMDDGFQHRAVKPDLSVILTSFDSPFYDDHLLPWGRLREAKVGARRASAIIVTKCPSQISVQQIKAMTASIQAHSGQEVPVFFSKIVYSRIKSVAGKMNPNDDKFIAFAGLADPQPFFEHVADRFNMLDTVRFPDHYAYTEEDLSELIKLAGKHQAALLTTEKDVVKLRHRKFVKILKDTPVYYISIEHKFINNGSVFDELVIDAIEEKYTVED